MSRQAFLRFDACLVADRALYGRHGSDRRDSAGTYAVGAHEGAYDRLYET